MRKFLGMLMVFLVMVLLANHAFAGGYGPSASAGASAGAKANVDNTNNLTGVVKGYNSNTNNVAGYNQQGQRQRQQQAQGQQQGQSQRASANNVNNVQANSYSFPGVPIMPLPETLPAYMEERLKYNDVSKIEIEDGVTVFTGATIREFFCGLSSNEREILRRDVQFIFYPAPPVPGLPVPVVAPRRYVYSSSATIPGWPGQEAAETAYSVPESSILAGYTNFLHGRKPKGIEGVDYFLVGEFKIYARPNDKRSLLADGNSFKYIAAQNAILRHANYFTILAWGGDNEQRNGSWAAGIATGGAGISGSTGVSAGGGFGVARSWSKKESRPWVYGKFYYIPPKPPVPAYVPPPSCSEQLERVDESLEIRSRCKFWCLRNLINNWRVGNADLDAYACTHNIRYVYDAIEAFRRAELNYTKAHLQRDEQAYWYLRGRPNDSVYLLWTYALKLAYGPERAQSFAWNHHLNINVNAMKGQGQ